MTSTVVWLNIYCLLNEYEPFKYYVEVGSRNIMYIMPSFSCNNHKTVVRCWFNILAMVLLVKDRKLPVSCIFLSLFSVKKTSNIALVTSDLLES